MEILFWVLLLSAGTVEHTIPHQYKTEAECVSSGKNTIVEFNKGRNPHAHQYIYKCKPVRK